jgi:hypothetical protein
MRHWQKIEKKAREGQTRFTKERAMTRKIVLSLMVVAFAVVPAFAGGRPEFDAVGDDSKNYFNTVTRQRVVQQNVSNGLEVNKFSDWLNFPEWVNNVRVWEDFDNTAGALYPDPCFENYTSAFVDAGNAAEYTWRIVLQMKPQSDIDLNIVDCVMKQNGKNIWTDAQQTGRYRSAWGRLFFVSDANPTLTVRAIPGPFATPGFETPFHMDGRYLPGLDVICLNNASYTSKAIWEEGVVIALPRTGKTTSCGDSMYNLKQGDVIEVTISVPGTNTADIRYGKDNVSLEYIGIEGTYFLHSEYPEP